MLFSHSRAAYIKDCYIKVKCRFASFRGDRIVDTILAWILKGKNAVS